MKGEITIALMETVSMIFHHINNFFFIALFIMGLAMVSNARNLMKKIFGLGIMQSAIFIFFISLGYVSSGTIPILKRVDISSYAGPHTLYANPIPQVLMLTAIVVNVAVTAIAYALLVAMKRVHLTIDEPSILQQRKDVFMAEET